MDLGAGAGHNARAICRLTGLRVIGVDVDDLSRVGSSPVLFDGRRLPFQDRSFAACTAIFVWQYVAEPESLWRELRRVVDGPVLILQSVVGNPRQISWLRRSDELLGPVGLRVAGSIGYFRSSRRQTGWTVERSLDCAAFQRWTTARAAGSVLLRQGPWPVGPLRHDLFRVEL